MGEVSGLVGCEYEGMIGVEGLSVNLSSAESLLALAAASFSSLVLGRGEGAVIRWYSCFMAAIKVCWSIRVSPVVGRGF